MRTGLGGGKQRPPEQVEHCRTENQAGKDLAEDRRLTDSVRERTGQLGRGNDERQNQQQRQ
jgi:hypothetical protein